MSSQNEIDDLLKTAEASVLESKDGEDENPAMRELSVVREDEMGSMRTRLLKDGKLSEGDVMRLTKFLEDLGVMAEGDLEIVAEAFFETVVTHERSSKETTPPILVFKMWRTLERPSHVDLSTTPSRAKTLERLEHAKKMMNSPGDNSAEKEINVAKAAAMDAGRDTPTSESLHEHSQKHVEGPLFEKSNAGNRPITTSTGTPACQRVKPSQKVNFDEWDQQDGTEEVPEPRPD
jgi:hypothetical protein